VGVWEAMKQIAIIVLIWSVTGAFTALGVLAVVYGAITMNHLLIFAGTILLGIVIEERADYYGHEWYKRALEECRKGEGE